MTDEIEIGSGPSSRPMIPAGPALGTWAAGWSIGAVLVTPALVLATGGSAGDDLTIAQIALVSVGSWSVLIAALFIVSTKLGSGDLLRDLGWSFRPVDLVGVPIGVATQLVAIPLIYWPLRSIWPDTFDSDEVRERAQDLADRAGGWTTLVLVVVVVVGAPVVEELVYRGLVQRSLTSATGAVRGLLVASALFAVIHFSPVEYPGLFVAGVVFGAGCAVTGRIGFSVVTHAAFNATGLVAVLST